MGFEELKRVQTLKYCGSATVANQFKWCMYLFIYLFIYDLFVNLKVYTFTPL